MSSPALMLLAIKSGAPAHELREARPRQAIVEGHRDVVLMIELAQ
jgi:hypothetical protein